MSSWGHRLLPLSESEAGYSCNFCRGDGETKPRAVCVLEYDYVTGKAGRVSSARRRLCLVHAEKSAERYSLHEQFNALRSA